jgi:hypothetical protein
VKEGVTRVGVTRCGVCCEHYVALYMMSLVEFVVLRFVVAAVYLSWLL